MKVRLTEMESVLVYTILNAGQFNMVGDIEDNIRTAAMIGTLKGKFQKGVLQVDLNQKEFDFFKNMILMAGTAMGRSKHPLFTFCAKELHPLYMRLGNQ